MALPVDGRLDCGFGRALGLLAQEVFQLGSPQKLSSSLKTPATTSPFDVTSIARTSDTQRYVADQVEILETNAVAEEASRLMAARDSTWIPTDMSEAGPSRPSRDVNLITVTYDADSAEAAAAGANSIVEAYEKVRTAQVQSVSSNVVSQIEQLKTCLTIAARRGPARDPGIRSPGRCPNRTR